METIRHLTSCPNSQSGKDRGNIWTPKIFLLFFYTTEVYMWSGRNQRKMRHSKLQILPALSWMKSKPCRAIFYMELWCWCTCQSFSSNDNRQNGVGTWLEFTDSIHSLCFLSTMRWVASTVPFSQNCDGLPEHRRPSRYGWVLGNSEQINLSSFSLLWLEFWSQLQVCAMLATFSDLQ